MSEQLINVLNYFRNLYPDLELIKEVKSGKEATVYLVSSADQLMALKVYRKFTQHSTRTTYLRTSHLASRTKRALAKKSRHGRETERFLWTSREFDLLKKLYLEGANVPEPFAASAEAILMEFIGTGENAAPRLIDIQLSSEVATRAEKLILNNIQLFWDLGFVHGDLSAYNILWWRNEPFIIDFPQALDITENKHAREKYYRDLENIQNYFRKLKQ